MRRADYKEIAKMLDQAIQSQKKISPANYDDFTQQMNATFQLNYDDLVRKIHEALDQAVQISQGIFASEAARLPRMRSIKRQPPVKAEKLLSFLISPEKLEEAIGDFEDGYRLLLERHGRGHARRWSRRWYCWPVFMGCGSRHLESAYRAGKIWSGFGAA